MMTGRFREVARLAEFDRDVSRLSRRYPTLEEDLTTLIDTSLFAFHKLGQDTGIVAIAGLGSLRAPVFKVRKFACRSLKGRGARSGLRVIYAYDASSDRIEMIEMYFKGDQEVENRDRIMKYFGVR